MSPIIPRYLFLSAVVLFGGVAGPCCSQDETTRDVGGVQHLQALSIGRSGVEQSVESIVIGERIKVVAEITLPKGDVPVIISVCVRPTRKVIETSKARFVTRTALGTETFPSALDEFSGWCPMNTIRVKGLTLEFDPQSASAKRGEDGTLQVALIVDTADLASPFLLGPGPWLFDLTVQESRTVPPLRTGSKPDEVYLTLSSRQLELLLADNPRLASKYFDSIDVPETVDEGELVTIAKIGSLEMAMQFPAEAKSSTSILRLNGKEQPASVWACGLHGMSYEVVVIPVNPETDEQHANDFLGALQREAAVKLKGLGQKARPVTVGSILDALESEVIGGAWDGKRARAICRTLQMDQIAVRMMTVGDVDSFDETAAKRFLDSFVLLSVDPVVEESHERP